MLGNEVSCMGAWEERIRAHLHLVYLYLSSLQALPGAGTDG